MSTRRRRMAGASSSAAATPNAPGLDPLLYSYDGHIMKTLRENPADGRGELRMQNHHNLLSQWHVIDENSTVVDAVKKAGLYQLGAYPHRWVDKPLISAFVERWHPETNTFHLPFGEMTITLDDVHQLLGVPVVGDSVCGENHLDDAKKLVLDSLGKAIDDSNNDLKGNEMVRMGWLRDKFRDSEDVVAQAKAYLLFLLGCIVFPDKTATHVDAHYLQSIEDLYGDGAEPLAWGMAILAFIYRQMGAASRSGCRQMGGCFTLISAWIYEHFEIRRPMVDPDYTEDLPRFRRWIPQASGGDDVVLMKSLRMQLDMLEPDDVIWDPYKMQRDTSRPLEEYAFYSGIIVCYGIGEAYYPERVLRQFGKKQYIPKDPMKSVCCTRNAKGMYYITYDVHEWIQRNWRDHRLHVDNRSTHVCYPSQCTTDYMEWFTSVSYPRVYDDPCPVPRPERASMHALDMLRRGMDVGLHTIDAVIGHAVLRHSHQHSVVAAKRLGKVLKAAIDVDDTKFEKRKRKLEETIRN